MTVMTRQQAELLEQLVSVAGSADIVEAALLELRQEAETPDLRAILRRILEIQLAQQEAQNSTVAA